MYYEKNLKMNYSIKKQNIRNFTFEALSSYVISIGEKNYRSKQIFDWLHNKLVNSIYDCKNIPLSLIEKLENDFDTYMPSIEEEYISKIDETKKYLIKLYDNSLIETVLMKYKYGYTICISSQVGCAMGCKFCASTIGGLIRNLEIYEMLSQIYIVSKINNIKISNVVIMGSGEPLTNYENLIKFLNIINDENGQNISLRNITISTCGIVPKIIDLASDNLKITLALSLHAPNDELRKKIMPIATKYSLDDTLNAMANYYKKTNRRITIEYSLIKNFNDTKKCLYELCDLLKKYFVFNGVDFNINLIPINNIKENNFERPEKKDIMNFCSVLTKNGIKSTIRRELGKDISGSCGQLRAGISR